MIVGELRTQLRINEGINLPMTPSTLGSGFPSITLLDLLLVEQVVYKFCCYLKAGTYLMNVALLLFHQIPIIRNEILYYTVYIQMNNGLLKKH